MLPIALLDCLAVLGVLSAAAPRALSTLAKRLEST